MQALVELIEENLRELHVIAYANVTDVFSAGFMAKWVTALGVVVISGQGDTSLAFDFVLNSMGRCNLNEGSKFICM